jgi:hypothetical protein
VDRVQEASLSLVLGSVRAVLEIFVAGINWMGCLKVLHVRE